MRIFLHVLFSGGLLLVLGFSACSPKLVPQRLNHRASYEPSTAIQHDLRAEGDSLHLYLKFTDPGPLTFPSSAQVTYALYLDYDQPDRIFKDTLQQAARHILKREEGTYLDFKIARQKLRYPSVLILKIASVNDEKNVIWYDFRLTAEVASKTYVLTDPYTGLPLFRNYVLLREPFLIEQYGVPLPGELHLYETSFGAARPPMARPETNVPPSLKKLRTFSFFEDTVSLPVAGLYSIEMAGTQAGGLLVEENAFPEVTSASELIQPLIYLTTAEERKKLYQAKEPKPAIDNFWLNITNGNQNEARRLIRLYYERVAAVNRFFTAHKAGWLTDRGMIYLIFGAPDEVRHFARGEEWTYRANMVHREVKFVFNKKDNTFTQNHYELVRTPYLEDIWYNMVEQWRRGTIAK